MAANRLVTRRPVPPAERLEYARLARVSKDGEKFDLLTSDEIYSRYLVPAAHEEDVVPECEKDVLCNPSDD